MRVLVTGGTGLVGRFIVHALLNSGHTVAVAGRTPPNPGEFQQGVTFHSFDLDQSSPSFHWLKGFDASVHAAFDHVPGRYRGGEGDDPEAFMRRNITSSIRLFEAARSHGVGRVIFLSSRAVYGAYPPGTALEEELKAKPDTLYGEAKLKTEQALFDLGCHGFIPIAVRATGVYGPSGPTRQHKWQGLFADYRDGKTIDARVATEVHGYDLARAVMLLLETAEPERLHPERVYNVSDIILDRQDLLRAYATRTGTIRPLPARGDVSRLNVMDCSRLTALGWQPRGRLDLDGLIPDQA